MKIVIWGIGTRGKRIFSRLMPGEVVAFIDSDKEKIGLTYEGIEIISLEQYIENYSKYFILISLLRPEAVIKQLREHGIYTYFDSLNCPVELWGPREYTGLDEYIETLGMGKQCGIFGTNFWAVYCYERMRGNRKEALFLIPEMGEDRKRIERIQESFEDIEILYVDQYKGKVNNILIATGVMRDVRALEEMDRSYTDMENIFDLSRRLPEYRNPELIQFKNIHKGKRCFIVATGPSLAMDDLDTIYQNNDFSIGMNRIYLAFEHTDWRPDYYMVGDWRCIKESGENIKALPIQYKFISDSYMNFWEKEIPNGVYKIHSHLVCDLGEAPPFSEDLVYGTYGGATITYECIQLAVYLGFEEIYLLGVDFDFSANYKDGYNHFITTYYDKNSETGFFLDRESLDAYRAAKEYADEHGIKIYNATRGGKLEIFERINFDTLF